MLAVAGEFTISGTGLQTVECDVDEIAFIVFIGANVNGSQSGVGNLGMYFGLAFRDEANPATLLNHCWFMLPNMTGGNRMRLSDRVLWAAATPSGGVQLEASIVSMPGQQFTINVQTCTASRVVRYLAVSLEDEIVDGFGHTGGKKDLPTSLDVGFRARSALGLYGGNLGGGAEQDTDYAIGAGNDPKGAIFLGVGAGSYPTASNPYGFLGAGIESSYQYQGSQRNWSSSLAVPNFFRIGGIGVIINTIVGGTRDMAPSSATALTIPHNSDPPSYQVMTAWDGSSSLANVAAPSSLDAESGYVDVSVANPDLNEIGAILWMAGSPYSGSSFAANGRPPGCGYGIWTPEYEGCVFVDGHAQALHQSSEQSWCISAGVGGANAGIALLDELDSARVKIKTTEVGGPAYDGGLVMFALGNPDIPAPTIYRHGVRYRH